MKKATRLVAALLAVTFAAATLAACSSDDDTRTTQTRDWRTSKDMRDQNRTYSRTSQK